MKAEDYVRSRKPNVRIVEHHGVFVGGKVRYEIMLGRKMLGCGMQRRHAWADAMRRLKERDHG